MSSKKKSDAKHEDEEPKSAEPAAAEAEAPNVEAPAPAPSTQPKAHRRPEGIALGRIVHYHSISNMGFATKPEVRAGIIVGLASPSSNFQHHDGAVLVKIFGNKPGQGDELKEVMFAHEGLATEGRWTFPPKV